MLLFLPPVASGSFVHDVDLKTPAWTPAKEELMVLSAAMHKLAEKNLPFERLVGLQQLHLVEARFFEVLTRKVLLLESPINFRPFQT